MEEIYYFRIGLRYSRLVSNTRLVHVLYYLDTDALPHSTLVSSQRRPPIYLEIPGYFDHPTK